MALMGNAFQIDAGNLRLGQHPIAVAAQLARLLPVLFLWY
jgi:hypothetical protein